jgi:hypothetical protein
MTSPRRSEAFWLALAIVVALALFALDLATFSDTDLIGLFAVPPFIAAVGTGRLSTGAVAALCVALALVVGEVDDFFGSVEHLVKAGLVGLAGLLATQVATIRARAEVSSRLDSAVARALAETGRLENAGARILPAIAEALEWDAAAMWEVDVGGGPLRCSATWRAPSGRLGRFEEFSGEAAPGAGIGLPGRVLAGGEPVWIEDIGQDETLPESQAASAIGIRSTVAFPITGEGGTRAVVILFSRRRRGRRRGPPRRGAARCGAGVRPRLRYHDEPRGPHRGVQPGGGADIRLSPGGRSGPDRGRDADPRSPPSNASRGARALPVHR